MSKFEEENKEIIDFYIKNEGAPWMIVFELYGVFEKENTWYDELKKQQTKFCEEIMQGNTETLSIKSKTLDFYYKLENGKEIVMHCIRHKTHFIFVSCNFNSVLSRLYQFHDKKFMGISINKMKNRILEEIPEVDDPVYRYIKNDTISKKDFKIIEKYVESYNLIESKIEEEVPFLKDFKEKFYNPESNFAREFLNYIYKDMLKQYKKEDK